MNKKLYRSRSNYVLGGVCAGLGDYLGIDPTFVRLFFLLMLITGGMGFAVYIILWIIMPREDRLSTQGPFDGQELGERARMMGDEIREVAQQGNPRAAQIVGFVVLGIGIFALMRTFNFSWWHIIETYTWPVLIIVAGVALLVRAFRSGE